jgi:hypothetical protein
MAFDNADKSGYIFNMNTAISVPDIENLGLEELIDLNHRVVLRIEYLQSLKMREHLNKFEVGDPVSFENNGRTIEGIITRINQKSVSVKTRDTRWTIHPHFLTKRPRPFGGGLVIDVDSVPA